MKWNVIFKGLQKFTGRSYSKRVGRKGVALITALIFLGVSMLLGLSLMLTTSSDVFMSGTMRNSKTAFYAADAGVSVMRNAFLNALLAAAPANVPDNNQTVLPSEPLDPAHPENGRRTTSAFNQAILQDAEARAGGVQVATISTYSSHGDSDSAYVLDTDNTRTYFTGINIQAPFQPNGPLFPADQDHQETYTFKYRITSNGGAGPNAALASSTVVEEGTITYNVTVHATRSDISNPWQTVLFSFAGYGMFVDHYDPHDGSTLLHGTITGRVHTNGEWGFSTGNPNYVFTDQVSSVSQNACYYFGSCLDRNADSATSGGRTIAPVFMSGFTRGVAAVPLPSNSNSQSRAVIDGAGIDINNPLQAPPAPSTAELGASLRNANGTAYSGGNGVYVPVQVASDDGRGHITYNTTGAGIYVNGNVTDMRLDATTPGLQIYTINQGGTLTTVTYNLTSNTVNGFPPLSSTISSGTRSITSLGLPTNIYPVNPNRAASIQPSASVSLYVNGAINSLHGPGAGLPGVADHAAMTITATGNISITGDLIYNTRPVTTTQGQVAPGVPANSPPGTLIPGNDNGQALGIYTANGNIYLDVSSIPSRNIEVDASMATLSNGGSGGITIANGVYPNNINIIGGRIQNNIMVLGNSSTVRNVLFDQRYAAGAYAPPFFPSTDANVARGTTTNTTYSYTVIPPLPNSVRALATSYTVPSRLITAANAGQ